ncbi:TPA: hypothetical protein SJ397_000183 [Yersinia enterocolitica]|nr:hypothetical protein [Yersinia enterocolitica]
MSEMKELKRFIYSATVTSGSGSQSFYIDAESREEADARAANNESDGMYADDSEVTDLDALDYEDETTVDDFGDFPLISREQSLIAQLEAAQKEIHDLKMKLSDAGCLLVEWKHRVEQSEYTANKAETALSAANEKLSKPVVLPDYRCSPDMHTKQYYETIGFNLGLDACKAVIKTTGFTVEGE